MDREIRGRQKSCTEQILCCFNRGGCWRLAPSKLICNADGTVVRINLFFEATGFCMAGRGIIDTIPVELYTNGLDRSDAESYLQVKLPLVNTVRSPCCATTLAFALCPCFWCSFCRWVKGEILQWDSRLREWQNEFNDTVLVRKGYFVKTQSSSSVTYNNKGEKQRHIERWIAIALTPEESELLRSEPHLIGYTVDLSCCDGVNEFELCMHP